MQATRSIEDDERLDWLRLIRTENVGPRTFHELVRHFGSPGAALAALPELARQGGRRRFVPAPKAAAVSELARAEAAGARMLVSCEPEYPALLAALDDPPPVIYVRGRAEACRTQAIAIVGARNASAAGRRFAECLARDLGHAGLVVVSGLARGIDTAAHRGALASETVAVLAGGVDVIYPPENALLAEAIAESGALISEQPPGLQPQARHFPRRNRLISGLAHGVVVVEAALRSGSLITARLALEQGREVFAVPGFPSDPRHGGTNRLLRDGAQFAEGPGDILEVIGPSLGVSMKPAMPAIVDGVNDPLAKNDLDKERKLLLSLLGPTPVEVDELIRQGELTPASAMIILLELELAGRLDRLPGQRVALRG